MDVQFITTSSAQLDNLPVVNGQIIAVFDELGYYYDMNNQRFPVVSSGTYYGTCTNQASAQNKSVDLSIPEDRHFELHVGTFVGVKFDADNTFVASQANPISLNVNSTGNKQIYAQDSAALAGVNTIYYGKQDYIIYYMYNGVNWVWAGSSADQNTTYTPQSLGFGYGTCTTASDTPAKVATLSNYQLVPGGYVSIRFTNAVMAGDTLNVNSKGAKAIYYQDAAITDDIIKAGDTVTFIYDNNRYRVVSIDSGTGSGGSTVIVTQILDTGTKIAEISVDGLTTEIFAPTGGSGSGHTIEDAEGTELTQRDTLQFAGYLKTTDNSTSEKTVVTDAPTEITYAAWKALSTAEKQGTHWLVTEVPGTIPEDTAIFRLKNQTLTFSTSTVTISDTRITTDTYPLVYWADTATAEQCGITAAVSTGAITFTASTLPTDPITCDIVFIGPAFASSSSGVSLKWSTTATATAGATSVTIVDSSLAVGSAVEVFTESTSGSVIEIASIQGAAGSVTLTFSALAAETSFKLLIIA